MYSISNAYSWIKKTGITLKEKISGNLGYIALGASLALLVSLSPVFYAINSTSTGSAALAWVASLFSGFVTLTSAAFPLIAAVIALIVGGIISVAALNLRNSKIAELKTEIDAFKAAQVACQDENTKLSAEADELTARGLEQQRAAKKIYEIIMNDVDEVKQDLLKIVEKHATDFLVVAQESSITCGQLSELKVKLQSTCMEQEFQDKKMVEQNKAMAKLIQRVEELEKLQGQKQSGCVPKGAAAAANDSPIEPSLTAHAASTADTVVSQPDTSESQVLKRKPAFK